SYAGEVSTFEIAQANHPAFLRPAERLAKKSAKLAGTRADDNRTVATDPIGVAAKPPPSRSPRPTIPSASVRRNASFPLALLPQPTMTEPSALMALAVL